ncbi:GrpB family protein [Paenibacillus sp. LjRoot153]|uniref:GrpB family protein n=1 Tax=Paenibacillus sp. LjRoot153 TaxID=3342270 RepID=UPI003ED1554D
MKRQWAIAAWTKEWNLQFEMESKVLQDIFQSEIVAIHHVGSTSVPAIGYAKPIIDILIIVKSIEQVNVCNEQMISAGYRVRGENGIPNRRYFSKGDIQRTHHVHIYQQGDSRTLTYLDFKAYLMQHPSEAEKYGQLKLDILASYPNDQYQQVKENRINHLVEKALRWGEEERKRLE